MRLYPGIKLNVNQNLALQIPRIPANPSRVDRLIVDLFREYTKVSCCCFFFLKIIFENEYILHLQLDCNNNWKN